MTRVAGHGLRSEGAPFLVSETGDIVRVGGWGVGGRGRAWCECGELSPICDSAGQRRQWHRDHKAEVTGG